MAVSCRNQEGFTLLETLMAFTVIAIAILGVIATMSNIYRLNTMRHEMALATFAAKKQIEEIKADTWDDITAYNTYPNNEFDVEGLADVGSAANGTITVDTHDDPDDAKDIHHVTVRVQWLSFGQYRRFTTMDTFISR